MIAERWKVTASVLTMPECTVTGYYVQVDGDHCVLTSHDNGCCEDYDLPIIVDPTTIQPVKVKPVRRDIYNENPFVPGKRTHLGNHPYCPNCEKLLGDIDKVRYCPGCGQALFWND